MYLPAPARQNLEGKRRWLYYYGRPGTLLKVWATIEPKNLEPAIHKVDRP